MLTNDRSDATKSDLLQSHSESEFPCPSIHLPGQLSHLRSTIETPLRDCFLSNACDETAVSCLA